MSSLQGRLLVASPHLSDPNFYKSVVLLVKHDAEGAFGLIMNRPTPNTVREVWHSVTDQELECEDPIYLGGPVSGPLVAIHALKSCAEAEVLKGLYFSAHKEQILKIISQRKRPFRLFSGYAGWAGGQLDGELQVGGWLSAATDKRAIFRPADELWEQVIRAIGNEILSPALKTRHVPGDPSLN